MEKTFEFNCLGYGGKSTITLRDESLTIARQGLQATLTHGMTGEKTIMLNQISAIQVKKCGFNHGYIQFVIPGSIEAKSGAVYGDRKNENIIYFDGTWDKKKIYNENAEYIKEFIEKHNANVNKGVVVQQESSKYDEIKKLKDLLDCGAITQQEFDEEKKKILNS